jgi:hypothetical protein
MADFYGLRDIRSNIPLWLIVSVLAGRFGSLRALEPAAAPENDSSRRGGTPFQNNPFEARTISLNRRKMYQNDGVRTEVSEEKGLAANRVED